MRAWIETMAWVALLGALAIPACDGKDEPDGPPDSTPAADAADADVPEADVGPETSGPGDIGADSPDQLEVQGDTAEVLDTDVEGLGEVVDTDGATPPADGEDTDETTPPEWGNQGDPCAEDEHCNPPLLCVGQTCQPKPALCGDGVLDDGEECDDGESNSDEVSDACRTTCVAPWCGDGVTDTGETCDDANVDETDGCSFVCLENTAYPKPAVGEIVLTELMINPAAAADPVGEWIELHNATDHILSLVGCTLHDEGTDIIPLGAADGLLTIDAGAWLVVGWPADVAINGGASGNGGVPVDVVHNTMLLDNVSDEVVLTCPQADGPVDIDAVIYDQGVFPVVPGASMTLDPADLDATSNDMALSWCSAETPYGDGDLGTPGEANPPCPVPDVALDHCELVAEGTATALVGGPVSVALNLTEAGLTDQSSGVDTSPLLLVQVGIAATGSDVDAEGWFWTAAAPAGGWEDPDGIDQHIGMVTADAAGVFSVAGRASLDLGETWTYCDLDVGSEDGFQPESTLQLTALVDPCPETTCDDPPPSECAEDGTTALQHPVEAALCEVVQWEASCSYPSAAVDCGAQGQICSGPGLCEGTAATATAASSLVLNELMLMPLQVDSNVGVWMEIYNAGAAPLDLAGCTLGHEGDEGVSLEDLPVLGAGGFRVVGPSAVGNGGAPVDLAFGNALNLGLMPATLVLKCQGALVDKVSYGTAPWPLVAGSSLSLSPYLSDAISNDDPGAWCAAVGIFGDGDLGTPGLPNAPCPGDEEPADECRLEAGTDQAPAVDTPAGTLETFAVRVVEAGITDATPQNDDGGAIAVDFGWGPPGTLPEDGGWIWHGGEADPAWHAEVAGAPLDEDRWEASLTAPSTGTYGLLARASVDGGHTWVLCDLDGSSNGVTVEQALTWTTSESPCDPFPCTEIPADGCQGDQVHAFETPVECMIEDQGALCTWTPVMVDDCPFEGANCAGGLCVDHPDLAAAGEVVFTELSIIPPGGESAEWIELTLAADSHRTLAGCEVVNDLGHTWLFDPDVPLDAVLTPGTAMVLARSADALPDGVQGFVTGETLSLGNVAGSVSLLCGGNLVDTVAWDTAEGWPVALYGPLALSGSKIDASSNDDPSAWCLAQGPGTPGTQNPLCPSLDGVVEDCVLEGPLGVDVDHGGTVDGALSFLDQGTTDATPGADLAPGLLAQVGYGPVGSTPGPGWVWFEATADLAWQDDGQTGRDRWQGTLAGAGTGPWAAGARASADGGQTFTLCDVTGTLDGYDPADGGSFSVASSPCDPNPCLESPESACVESVLLVYGGPGACSVDESGVAQCAWTESGISCIDLGGCQDGACVEGPEMPTTAGDVVLTEVHRDSTQPPPDQGEWLELHNPTEETWDLRGCTLTDDGGDSFTVEGALPVTLEPGAYLVAGASADLGLGDDGAADIVYSGVSLSNLFDEVIFTCGDVVVDRVAWTPEWPGDEGASMHLDPEQIGADTNDSPTNWCLSTVLIGSSAERGSPGAANPDCF